MIAFCMICFREIPPFDISSANFSPSSRALDACEAGSLTGAVASQRVTEACKGRLRLVSNQLLSVRAKACLTVKLTS